MKQTPKEIFILGQSVSLHWGVYFQNFLGNKYVYLHKTGKEEELKKYPELQKENGGDSATVLKYLDVMKNSLSPYMLIFGAGLHDIRRDRIANKIQISLPAYKKNLENIISLYKERVGYLVWMTTTSFDESVHNKRTDGFFRFLKDNVSYHQTAIKIMKENDIPIVDLRSFTENFNSKDKLIDHIHFSEKMRENQAKFVADWIKNLELSRGCGKQSA